MNHDFRPALQPAGRAFVLAAAMLLASCAEPVEDVMLGETEFDYVDIPAEAGERIVELAVREGQAVAAGDLIARLDDARVQFQLDGARAGASQAEAALQEAARGARIETIDAARAGLRRSDALWTEAHTQLQRTQQLRKEKLVAQQALDSAQANERRARAERDAVRAELEALLHGTREEQVAQAQAVLAAARARVAELELVSSRYQLRAPRDGTIDSLLFELGDRPSPGAPVARIAIGSRPYVRVFVPASQRAALQPGNHFDIDVIGLSRPLHGRLRHIAREPAFTPYYALMGDDASRLVFRAEIELETIEGDASESGDGPGSRLAAGLPATVRQRERSTHE